ncbi:MAG TPA: hypothetical protein VJN63_09810 [Thermoplasmata archaeon]|nr:hypothetical protein [Thermoplasmata archaeon]
MPMAPMGQGGRVQPRGFAAPSVPGASSSMGGGPIAQAARGLRDDLERFALQQVQHADEIRVNEARNAYEDGLLAIRNDESQKKMRDAIGSTDRASAREMKLRAELAKGLNSQQMMAFTEHADRSVIALRREFSRREGEETAAYDSMTTEAMVAAARENAEPLIGLEDPARADEAVGSGIVAPLMQWAARNGIPDAARDLRIREEISRYHAQAIRKLDSMGKDVWAAAYVERYGDALIGDDRVRANQLVSLGSMRGATQRAADEIMSQGLSQLDAVKMAREVASPPGADAAEFRDRLVDRVRNRYSEMLQVRREEEQERERVVTDMVYDPENFGRIPEDFIPADQWSTMGAREQELFRELHRNVQAGRRDAGGVEVYEEAMADLAQEGGMDRFLAFDPLADPRLRSNPDRMRDILQYKNQLRGELATRGKGGKTPAMDRYDTEITFQQLVTEKARINGMDADPGKQALLASRSRQWVRDEEVRVGHPLDFEEVETVVRNLAGILAERGSFEPVEEDLEMPFERVRRLFVENPAAYRIAYAHAVDAGHDPETKPESIMEAFRILKVKESKADSRAEERFRGLVFDRGEVKAWNPDESDEKNLWRIIMDNTTTSDRRKLQGLYEYAPSAGGDGPDQMVRIGEVNFTLSQVGSILKGRGGRRSMTLADVEKRFPPGIPFLEPPASIGPIPTGAIEAEERRRSIVGTRRP